MKRKKVKIIFRRDPERDRMLFKLLRRIRELTPSEAVRGTTVSPQTIINWRKPVASGGTKFPQFATMELVAKANGMTFKLVDGEEAGVLAAYRADNDRPALS